MNVDLMLVQPDIDESREIVSGLTPLATYPTILIQDPDYHSAYQVWFQRADRTGFIHVTPDGEVVEMPVIMPILSPTPPPSPPTSPPPPSTPPSTPES